jgi:maltooligosyltrehalose trehalohydrolase
VTFIENHDQVANHSFGDRLSVLGDGASLRAMTAVLLLGPQIPMLFQGQETGSRRPFQFFIDHDNELNRLVREGRAEFLKQFARLATPEAQAAIPLPDDPATFANCVLDPAERTFDNPSVQLHRDLLGVRREHTCFTQWTDGRMRGAVLGDNTFCVRWFHDAGDRLLLVNLGNTFRAAVLPEPLLAPPQKQGWRIAWSSEHPRYGGHGTPEPFTHARLAVPARASVLLAPDPDACLRVDPPPDSGEKVPVEP